MKCHAHVELVCGEKRLVGCPLADSIESEQLKESSIDYAEGHEAGYALGYRAAVHDTLECKKGDKHT